MAVAAIAGAAAKAANAYKDCNTELQKTKSAADQLLTSYADGNSAKQLDEAATRDLLKLYPELRGEVSAYATTVEEAAEKVQKLTEQKVLESAAAQIAKLQQVDEGLAEAERSWKSAKEWSEEGSRGIIGALTTLGGGDAAAAMADAERRMDSLGERSERIRDEINAALSAIGYRLEGYNIVKIPVTLSEERIPEEVAAISAAVEAAVPPDFGREWQDKILEGAEKIIREREKAIQALEAKGTESFGIDFASNSEYKAELAALMEYYQRELDKLGEKKPAALFDDEWTRKNMDELQRLERDYQDSIDKLEKAAKESFGSAWQTNEAYIKEAAELERWYANERIRIEEEIARKQREELINRHQTRMDQLAEEGRYIAAMGLKEAESGNVGGLVKVAVGTMQEGVAGTQLGSAAMSAAGGAASGGLLGAVLGPIAQFITALVEAILALENVQKILNFASTIIERMMDVIGPMLNDGLQPIVDLLETLGDTLGKMLAPLINMANAINAITLVPVLKMLEAVLSQVGAVFEWLNNDIIVPFGNALIDIANGIIDLLNKIPGVDIDRIARLRVVGDMAEEMAKEAERQMERVRIMYERQKSAVEDKLRSQLEALDSQYELGLISRDEYEKQAEKYSSAADDKLISINERMEEHLAAIEDFTGAALTEEQWKNLYNNASDADKQSYAQKWGEKVPVLGHLAGTVADVGAKVWDGLKSAGKTIASWFGFDVGTPFVPQDMPAMVHKGETIVPRTFADGIRSGELALVGRKGQGGAAGGGSPVYVTVNVGGSVLSERDLVNAVHRGIADGISSRRLDPLPAGGAA